MNNILNKVYDWIMYYARPELKQRKDLHEYLYRCCTTSHCGSAAIHCFKYVHDDPTEDYWQTPAETWNRRDKSGHFLGDCDDWARFFAECLNGDKPLLLVMWDSDSGHMTCAIPNYEHHTLMSYTTVGTFGRVEHDSWDLEDIVSYWYPAWRGFAIYSQVYTQGEWTIKRTDVYYRKDISGKDKAAKPKFSIPVDELILKLMNADEEIAGNIYDDILSLRGEGGESSESDV